MIGENARESMVANKVVDHLWGEFGCMGNAPAEGSLAERGVLDACREHMTVNARGITSRQGEEVAETLAIKLFGKKLSGIDATQVESLSRFATAYIALFETKA